METRQVVGLMGALALVGGVFAPILDLPGDENLNMFVGGRSEALLLLLAAAAAAIFAMAKRCRWLWAPAFASAAVAGKILYGLVRVKNQVLAEATDARSLAAANSAIAKIELRWGWVFLILGFVLLIWSATMRKGESD